MIFGFWQGHEIKGGGRGHDYGLPALAEAARPGCGWPYSFVAALEPGRTSWTQTLHARRLGPADDATAVTAGQLRQVIDQLIGAGHWRPGDPDILVVADTGYDTTRLAWVLSDLPGLLIGRIRADRVLRLPTPTRTPATIGRPRKHGDQFRLGGPEQLAGTTTRHHHRPTDLPR